MKIQHMLFSLVLAAVAASAGPITTCPPNFNTDGIAVSPSCAGLGADVFAAPGSTWTLAFNDNPGGGDQDYNDLLASIVVNSTGTDAVVTWDGALSSIDNSLYDGTHYLFSNSSHPSSITIATIPGAEIHFDLHSNGNIWYTGPAWVNSDDQIHDYAKDAPASAVPEPSSGTLGAVGLGAMVLMGSMVLRRR